jgi:hypothetical protein
MEVTAKQKGLQIWEHSELGLRELPMDMGELERVIAVSALSRWPRKRDSPCMLVF